MHTNTRCAPARCLAAALSLAFAAVPASAQSPALLVRIGQRLDSARERLVAIRRDIHQHPELSGQEVRTAGLVADRLRALGLEVRTGVGGHGVVGALRGRRPGPVVGYRADMDAVRSDDADPVPFASRTPGVRHICGHDIHTTIALGIAEALGAIRERLPGTVVFYFQPAEENIEGARAMIAAGALRDPAPAAVFAVHSSPLEVGQVGSVEGLALPGLRQVVVSLRGTGDLRETARAYVRAISRVSTGRDVPPANYVNVLIRSSRAGSAEGEWRIIALVRAGSPEARTRAVAGIERVAGEVQAPGVRAQVADEGSFLPDMVNDTPLVRGSLPAIRAALGTAGLVEVNAVTPFFSEDFSVFQQQVPGAMYWLGVANSPRGLSGALHSADFVPDEEAIVVGAKAMAAVLLRFLEGR